ncbi:TonB-dependent receptor [Stenotrophomonas tumulicola]|uniref:TonB-dependent receptor n=1 Tax=Stenotrophomonas tumulicola TaxID=1685415 RepID=A0A7W3FQJ2_9GAMM|nr:TonB-dependent receptor [Stenotrophomonas tumulicola]MBA8683894.1 TonB-dependent receptor [Stenotrophomonas tumulicola]
MPFHVPLRRNLLALLVCAALPSLASAESAPTEGPSATTLDSVSVTGRGEARQVQRVTAEDMKVLPPGANPLKLLATKPGVHFESADATGAYEWSTSISLRGFNQSRLGYTLDGIPLGNMAYGNSNGLHVSRAVISENLAGAEVSTGIGALGTPSTSNLGGVFQFFSIDPSPEYGVTLAQGFGTDSARRTYARLDTGEHQGFAAYLSGVYSKGDKWKGWGDQELKQFNGKATYHFGEDNKLTAIINSSRRVEADYQDLSLEMIERLGWNWDNYAPDWARAVAAANGQYSGNVNSPWDAYFSGHGVRNDDLASLAGDFGLNDAMRLKANVYHHSNRGQGHWFSPSNPSNPGTDREIPISIRTTEYAIDRTGVTAAFTWQLGGHELEAGFWYEDNGHSVARNFYYIDGPLDDGFFLRNPDERLWLQRFTTITRQVYVQDRFRLLDDRLTVDVGFKSPNTRTTVRTPLGDYADGSSLSAKDSFLPQAGFNFKLNAGNEIFGSYAKNIAAYALGVGSPFNVPQAAFDSSAANLEPEQSRTIELGWRGYGQGFEASLAVFDVKFDNRLLAIAQCVGILGCPALYSNVGSVTSRGAEATFQLKPARDLSWTNALSFNDSTYDDDYLNNGVVPTGGKKTVDTPEWMFATQLAWTPGPWDLRLSANHVGKRYVTYTNDLSVPSYWLLNAAVAYDFGAVGPVQNLSVALNLTNLADKTYLASINTNGTYESDPTRTSSTMQVGAPRQAMLTVTARF